MRYALYLLLVLCAPGVLLFGGSKQRPASSHSAPAPEAQGRRSYLGVGLVDLSSDRLAMLQLDDDRGVEVTRVQADSPAEKAGLKAGDILLGYNDENVLSVQQLARLVAETPSGRKVRVQFWRGGKVGSVHLTTEAPSEDFLRKAGASGGYGSGVGLTPAGMGIVNMPTPAVVWRNFTLGINCEPVESQLAAYFGVKRGLLVRYVDRNSLADRAGLQAGDVIVAIADRATETPQDLGLNLGSALRSAQSVPLSLVRDHKRLTVSLPTHE